MLQEILYKLLKGTNEAIDNSRRLQNTHTFSMLRKFTWYIHIKTAWVYFGEYLIRKHPRYTKGNILVCKQIANQRIVKCV